jgi:hypothetical protein
MAISRRGCRGEVGFTSSLAQAPVAAMRDPFDPPLTNQHAVPVAVEAVAFPDRMPIGFQNIFTSRKG